MMIRLFAVVAAFAVLGVVAVFVTGDVALLLDVRAAAVVLGGPWLIAVTTWPVATVTSAIRDAFDPRAEDLPLPRRERSADVLRGLARQALALGVVMLLAGALHAMSRVAHAGGSVSPADIVGTFGGVLLAPVYGLALSAFFYEPLAARLGGISETLSAGWGPPDSR